MFKNLLSNSKILYNRSLLQVKKYSPEILTGIGIIGVIGGTVLACKETMKLNDILNDKKKKINDIHKCLEDKDISYEQKDADRDVTLTYVNTGFKVLKLYSPAIIVTGLSIGSIISGQHILKKRNIALAAAYGIVSKSFQKYRENVIEEYGQGVDQAMRFGLKESNQKSKKSKKDKNEESNNDSDEQKEIIKNDDLEYSDYARFFDASCNEFKKDPEFNLMYLRRQQDYANEMLKSRGHLFLNEVYDLLDIPRTKAGQIVGWVYDPKNNKNGDNYVDFGIYKDCEPHRRFVNGLEYNILLDFNVDGPIYDLI